MEGTFIPDSTVEEDTDERVPNLEYISNGIRQSLTAVTRILRDKPYNENPTPFWPYNGEKPQEIYVIYYLIHND